MSEMIAYTGSESFNPGNVDPANYTSTLAEEALRCGIYTEEDIGRIQMGLMESLSEVIGFYTKGESTSVKTERAAELSRSILYNADTYLRSLGSHSASLEKLKERKMTELYGKGYLINKERCEKAKILYAKARYSRLKDGSAEYNKTLDKYLYNYLKMYDPKFTAHDRLYVSLPEVGFKGGLRINRVVELLEAIIKLNAGRQSDVILESPDGNQ
ncbi:MAG: hypothetical protein E7638_08220 [Ruminococcaceae bacterium]|nr:hypothetical protein [Oscillospiraceae bacterium]